MNFQEEERLLVLEDELLQSENGGECIEDGTEDIDFKKPLTANTTGGWRACSFILGTECCERLAYQGIAKNLVTYLTQKLHQGNASAATNVSTWQGTCYVAPLIGAVFADAYFGRYKTIAFFSSIYFMGMVTLTLSASFPLFRPPACEGINCSQPTSVQSAILFTGLYVIALGTGGIKPCVSSFGADQFDDPNQSERGRRGSFFNWFYFSINIGSLLSSVFLVWIQDNLGWSLGFGIPTVFMGLAIGTFLIGTPLYKYQKPGGNPLTRMLQVVVASFRKFNTETPQDCSLLYELPDKSYAIKGSRKLEHTDEYRFLDGAAVVTDSEIRNGNFSNPWMLCTVTQVEELKALVHMFPIWATTIAFYAVGAQMFTTFVVQGMVMDTVIGPFTIPPASLSFFDVISVIIWVPIYDKILVPMIRKFTGKEGGFTMLQRMGIGLFISILAMIAAALVEMKRLGVARTLNLVDEKVAVPISILWQIPQFFLVGAGEVFVFIGQLEFFYDQSPDTMRTLCSALSLLTAALGIYLNSFILTIVTLLTTKQGKPGWIPDNLNEGHLDYYFWLVAVLCFFNLVCYIVFSTRYTYKRTS